MKVMYVDSFTFQMYGMAVADKLDKSKHRTIFQRRYFRQVCTRRANQLMCPYFVHRPSKYAPALYKGSLVDVPLLVCRPSKYAPALYKGSSVDVPLLVCRPSKYAPALYKGSSVDVLLLVHMQAF